MRYADLFGGMTMRNKISLAVSSLTLALIFLYSLGPGRDAVDRLPLICSLLLYTTSLLLPLQLGYRQDAIRLLAGISRLEIWRDNFACLFVWSLAGSLLGTLLFALLFREQAGLDNLAFLLLVELSLICFSLLLMKLPRKFYVSRGSGKKQGKIALRCLQVSALLLLAWSLPQAALLAKSSYENYQSKEKWQSTPAAVSFDDDGRLDRQAYYPAELALIKDEEGEDNAVLSLIMDDQMQTSPAELGGYDHIVFVNDQALKLAGVSQQDLKEVALTDLSAECRNFLRRILPLNTAKRQTVPKGMHLLTSRKKLAALNETQDFQLCRHPLLIYSKRPSQVYDMHDFLYPALSTGNLFFIRSAKLIPALKRRGLAKAYSPEPFRLKLIAQSKLDLAKLYLKSCLWQLLNCILLLFLLASILNYQAGAWVQLNRSKVFALFTSGHKWSIIFPQAAEAAALALLVCFLVTAILLVLYAASPAGLLICQFSFILLYTLVYGKLLSKKSKTEVKRMIGRKG
ncbi:hypothetical protein FYJ62_04920 [Lactobacillus porci]|uniref:Uncharacterized protein n=1 Tax=Lactobacillus porci TaxID=2012477 RepID=A0A6A8MDZ3_9LACO|nr:hypothetical protein [Lactobacillus porci]